MRLRSTLLAAAVTVAALPLAQVGATASPVCTGEDKSECGGRTFPEPRDSDTALQYELTVDGLQSLEAEFPDLVEIEVLGQTSEGRDLLNVELTDESVDIDDKRILLVSQSIHGNEPGGREGGVRWLEDVLRDPEHPSRALLDEVVVAQVFLNPDGWAAGDPTVQGAPAAGQWSRGNGPGLGDFGSGTDLNRQFPWRGFIPDGREPVSEPESQAMVDEVTRRLDAGQDIAASVDIHGEVGNAGALTMLSSGEFDLAASMTQLRHAQAIDVGVTAEIAGDPLLGDTPPVVIHASSEFGRNNAGGSGSGFLGDWLSQVEGGGTISTSTIELLNADGGPGTNATTANLELLQLYRDTVAGVMTSLTEQSALVHTPSVELPGTVGYVRDPATTTDPVLGGERTAMRFFDDLDPYLSIPLRPIPPGAVATSLDGLAAVVVPSDVADDPTTATALRDFAMAGGQVVLTDTGVRLLDDLVEGIDDGDITMTTDDFTVTNFDAPSDDARDHPLIDGIREIAFMLTEPATIGYRVTGGGDTPAHNVDRASFEAAGGTTVAVTADQTGVGVIGLGDGEITVLNTLLPPPTDANRSEYGLNDHGVLDTGYRILFNAIGADLSVTTGAVDAVAPNPTPMPDAEPSTPDLAPGDPDSRSLERVAGDDRLATAVEISRLGFERAESVVLARADAFPDALAGSVLAVDLGAPILLTDSSGLSDVAGEELRRLEATEVVLLGGETALSAQVARDIEDLGLGTRRLGGDDRHATARLIAEALVGTGESESAILTRSDDFPDALAASNLATALRAPIVLTPSDSLDDDAIALLEDSVEPGSTIVIAGGPMAISTAVQDELEDRGYTIERVAGGDRYATAVMLGEQTLDRTSRTIDSLFLASGTAFPDALTAGPVAARRRGLLVLVDPDDLDASAPTRDFLRERGDEVSTAYLVGGPAAVSTSTEQQLRTVLGIPGRR